VARHTGADARYPGQEVFPMECPVSFKRLSLGALSLGAALALPAPAQAQLGRFIKQKAAEKTADKVVDKGTESVTGRPATVRDAKFDDHVLEITEARFDAALKGLAAERATVDEAVRSQQARDQQRVAQEKAFQAKEAAFKADLAAYEKKQAAYNACIAKADMELASAPGGVDPAKMAAHAQKMENADLDALEKRMQDLQKRFEAARARDDKPTILALQDTLQREMQQVTGMTSKAAMEQGAKSKKLMADREKCGTAPTAPTEPKGLEKDTVDVRSRIDKAVEAASGMKVEQYGIIRERIAAYAVVNGEFKQGNLYAFSKSELEVLKRKVATLPAYQGHKPSESEYWTVTPPAGNY
jgi:hypothetical protein